MSDAGFHFRRRPASPVALSHEKRRTGVYPSDGSVRADGECAGPAAGSSFDDEPHYPLDPPLVDVRIPVKPPHATATTYSCIALMHRFPGIEVGNDLHMLFSEPGKAKQSRLSPDVLVALNVSRNPTRDDYDADRHGPPDFVLEVLSRSTWEHDVGRKLDCYQQIGVRECLLFDVKGEDRAGTGKELWGFALTPESRRPLAEVVLPNGERGVCSAVLGLVAYVAERTPPQAPKETWTLTMCWHDPATGTDIPDYDQSRAETEAALRRVAELEEQLRLRDEQGRSLP